MSLNSVTPVATDYGEHEAAMVAYRASGEARALALGNRGPIRFDADGSLSEDILEAYWRCGFYVFENVLRPEELLDLERDIERVIDGAPVEPDVRVDRHGRPSLNADREMFGFSLIKPLSDPVGGTERNQGRHPARMIEPTPPDGAPDYVLQVVSGALQYSDASLRVYGHPDLLRVAEAINGEDFTPFNEVMFIKHPGLGGSVAWHQDGTTHWDTPIFDKGTHGFNFMAQVYGCNAANGLWIVPGSHLAKADIKTMCDDAGSDRLPEAVPLLCAPGDVGICNRQAVHGSFANTSPNIRVTINFGFHRRASVLGARGNGIHAPGSDKIIYDADRIRKRSRMIGYAIDARRQRFPDEDAFRYQPHVREGATFEWNDAGRERIKDYNLLDLGI
ncbi:MAG: phytanoyl-CoA dioxygenase family protein [Gammaproteobacteria bacterium]|nr:phytanoyl-CoA dioxygenase family protein [Gammaproteobacteria bacterium]MDE0450514.1 phytanoyl-CoA dioxygenase family protein [Gammaproteobacteria bacterium]